MKLLTGFALLSLSMIACNTSTSTNQAASAGLPIEGTWQLVTGTTIEKNDTVTTDYTKTLSFIKVINGTHFSFLKHDLQKGKDSATASFGAGGGHYTLKDSTYTEHLEYCSDRVWEGNDFTFTLTIKGDTLTQSGIEKVDSANISRLNIEKYVRAK